MSKSKPKRASARKGRPAGASTGGRLQTVGLFVALLAVAALVASLVWGVWDRLHPSSASAPPPSARAAAPDDASRPLGRVRVQVLNASGIPGQAKRAMELLRDRGFDVVETGNAPRTFSPQTSLVLDRLNQPEAARQVAAAAGIARTLTRADTTLQVEATVILGRDWHPPAP